MQAESADVLNFYACNKSAYTLFIGQREREREKERGRERVRKREREKKGGRE